jgi:hypothetical protein
MKVVEEEVVNNNKNAKKKKNKGDTGRMKVLQNHNSKLFFNLLKLSLLSCLTRPMIRREAIRKRKTVM